MGQSRARNEIAVFWAALSCAALSCAIAPRAAMAEPSISQRLMGRWEGKPVVDIAALVGPDLTGGILAQRRSQAEELARTLRLTMQFEKNRAVVMTLHRLGAADDTKSGQWKVIESTENSAVVAITVQTDGRRFTKRLEIQFGENGDFMAREIDGDLRAPALLFTRSE